ncbi:YfiR family protein [Sphingomonas sp.]|uniref:YfiR family protein n=1 Tax=Sphingomonas sp. TaxID=28214 RepID=UPI002ED7ED14
MSASIGSNGLIAETRVPPGQHDAVVARTVGGMISYTRWPQPRAVVRLCVSGATAYTKGFGRIGQNAGRQIFTQTVAPGGATEGCDVLYFGTMADADRQRMLRSIRDQPVLSIAEADPSCRGGTIFCMRVLPDRVGFQLSIDAVSRSAVRIDPRVLRIALPERGA